MSNLLICDGNGLILRAIEYRDAEFLMELNNDRDISHFVVGNPQIVTLQEQIQWIAHRETEPNCHRFMVEYNDILVGTVIISAIDEANLTANISIKLHKTAQGKGIGKMVIQKVTQYCFSQLGLVCLTARVLTYNAASIGLFTSCGYINEGILRSRVIKDGKRCDLISFSKIRE